MKGINKIEHRKLVSSLMIVERYLYCNGTIPCELQLARSFSKELETAFNNYEQSIKEIERQISAYNELYNAARTKFLGYKLKELKKRLSSEDFLQLQENFRGY